MKLPNLVDMAAQVYLDQIYSADELRSLDGFCHMKVTEIEDRKDFRSFEKCFKLDLPQLQRVMPLFGTGLC